MNFNSFHGLCLTSDCNQTSSHLLLHEKSWKVTYLIVLWLTSNHRNMVFFIFHSKSSSDTKCSMVFLFLSLASAKHFLRKVNIFAKNFKFDLCAINKHATLTTLIFMCFLTSSWEELLLFYSSKNSLLLIFVQHRSDFQTNSKIFVQGSHLKFLIVSHLGRHIPGWIKPRIPPIPLGILPQISGGIACGILPIPV